MMRLQLAWLASSALLLAGGCARMAATAATDEAQAPRAISEPPSATAVTTEAKVADRSSTTELEVDAPSDKEARGLVRLSLPSRGSLVSAFVAQTEEGDALSSKALVGQVPVVVVFFTSWCPVCERKMPLVRQALEAAAGDVLAIGVAMDDEDTFDDVPAYATRHGIPFRIVRGESNPDLVQALDPRGSFPIVYVIGRAGTIVDVQIGLQPDHRKRLEQALHAAQDDPPR